MLAITIFWLYVIHNVACSELVWMWCSTICLYISVNNKSKQVKEILHSWYYIEEQNIQFHLQWVLSVNVGTQEKASFFVIWILSQLLKDTMISWSKKINESHPILTDLFPFPKHCIHIATLSSQQSAITFFQNPVRVCSSNS